MISLVVTEISIYITFNFQCQLTFFPKLEGFLNCCLLNPGSTFVAPKSYKEIQNIKNDKDIFVFTKQKPCSYKSLNVWQQQVYTNFYIVYTYAAKIHRHIVIYTTARHKTVNKWNDTFQLGFH